jgi:hypothetical protein
MLVRLTQIDGKLPNLALMKLAAHHRARGDEIVFSKHVDRDMLEPRDYGCVYGSAIFSRSAERVRRLRVTFPEAIVGGTWDIANNRTVEDLIGESEAFDDYSLLNKSRFPYS